MHPTQDPSLDIGRYAEILAHVRHYPADRHAEVIARLGIRRANWEAASSKWQRVRESERTSGKLDATIRFGRVLRDTRAALEARQPTLESLGPLPGPDGDLTPGAKSRHAKEEPVAEPKAVPEVAAPAVQVPSFLMAVQHGSPQVPEPLMLPMAHTGPPASVASTLPVGSVLPLPAVMPFAETPTSPAEAFDRARTAGIAVGSAELALPAGVPDLTIHQYASLRAELQASPEHAATILSRYGVAPSVCAALVEYWRSRLMADPTSSNAFTTAYTAYVAWLEKNRTEPSPPSREQQPPESVSGTQQADLRAIIAAAERGALPFANRPAGNPFPSPRSGDAASLAQQPPENVAGTQEADLRAIIAAVQRGALPFTDQPAGPLSPLAATPASPKMDRPPEALAGTTEADFSAIVASIRSGALPFADASRSPPTPPALPSPPPAPTSTAATQALPGFDFDRYPLDLYARITGALARGEPRDDVLAAHELTSDLFDKIARAWTARFNSEPALFTRFKELVRSRGG